jgi:general secretion pathway protein D
MRVEGRSVPAPAITNAAKPAPAPSARSLAMPPTTNRISVPSRPAVTTSLTNAAPAATVGTAPPVIGVPPISPPANLPPELGSEKPFPVLPSGANPADEIIPAGVINFKAVDLDQVFIIYSELVGRTILRPTALPAPVITLKTQTALTKKEAIQALDAVLALNGIAMINVGDKFVKAVPASAAGQQGAPWNKQNADEFPEMGQYVTHVVQLKYAKPTEIMPALQPFASTIANPILPIDSSQLLVLRDYTENVKRMLEMIGELDVTVPSEFISEVIPIKYAKASEIANALNSLGGGGGTATVGSSGSGGGTRSRSAGGTSGLNRGTGFGGSGGFGSPGYNPGGYNPGGAATPQATATPGTGSSFTDRLQNIIRRASNTPGEIQILGNTKMIADERTNSLLIFATKEDMKMIKDVVSKLDIVLAQVLIEAVIIEVTLNDSRDLGVSYLQHPQTSGKFTGVGGINNVGFLNPNNFNLSGATNAAGSLNGGLSYLGSFGQDLDVTLTAVAGDSRAKILQRPRIQTSHNEPASLFVGESRPYPNGSYYGGGGFGGYSSIQQIPIGVTLEVTPLINPDGLVVMDIHQKIESANGTVHIDNVGDVPITTQKDASAKVSVRDRDTIILGGLIETSKSRSGSGVPFLKDIPVLGYLFRSTSTKENQNELVVLIRPTVLPTPEVASMTAKVEKDKMPGVRRAEREFGEDEARQIKRLEKEEEKRRQELDGH